MKFSWMKAENGGSVLGTDYDGKALLAAGIVGEIDAAGRQRHTVVVKKPGGGRQVTMTVEGGWNKTRRAVRGLMRGLMSQIGKHGRYEANRAARGAARDGAGDRAGDNKPTTTSLGGGDNKPTTTSLGVGDNKPTTTRGDNKPTTTRGAAKALAVVAAFGLLGAEAATYTWSARLEHVVEECCVSATVEEVALQTGTVTIADGMYAAVNFGWGVWEHVTASTLDELATLTTGGKRFVSASILANGAAQTAVGSTPSDGYICRLTVTWTPEQSWYVGPSSKPVAPGGREIEPGGYPGAVPEPTSGLLVALGVGLLALRRARRAWGDNKPTTTSLGGGDNKPTTTSLGVGDNKPTTARGRVGK